MVIDTRIVVAGSFNYTAPANEYNDENLFVIGSPHEAAYPMWLYLAHPSQPTQTA